MQLIAIQIDSKVTMETTLFNAICPTFWVLSVEDVKPEAVL
jgi:hypothetical protein